MCIFQKWVWKEKAGQWRWKCSTHRNGERNAKRKTPVKYDEVTGKTAEHGSVNTGHLKQPRYVAIGT